MSNKNQKTVKKYSKELIDVPKVAKPRKYTAKEYCLVGLTKPQLALLLLQLNPKLKAKVRNMESKELKTHILDIGSYRELKNFKITKDINVNFRKAEKLIE